MPVKEMPGKWDHEADVVVVGGGTAGLPAGIIIAEAELKATVLETRKMLGGSFRMVWGSFVIAGTEEQKERGIDDNPELLYQDMINVAGADPKLARAYADTQLDAYRMLKEEGVAFPGIYHLPGQSRARGLGPLSIGNMGKVMVDALEKRARRVGVEILSEHRARRLIEDPATGRVVGVIVEAGGKKLNFKARKGVILGTGGFGHNLDIVAEYAPQMVNCVPVMPPSHQGDGLKMAQELGAATKDIGIAVAPAWCVDAVTHANALRALNFGAIMVNTEGQRFADESYPDSYYGPMTGVGMKQEGGFYWVVYNQVVIDNIIKTGESYMKGGGKDFMEALNKCKQLKGNSVEELAKVTAIDARGLKETLAKYNGDIASAGYDTVFGRRVQKGGVETPIIKIDSPPYYAVKCITSTTSMKGGLKINDRCQVIDQYGEVIPGLYAAGEVTGGLHTRTYLLGVMSSSSFAQGIIAARQILKEPSAK